MSQTGYTPIQLYYSTTAAAVPVNTNLANGELAINITDGKLYYKNNSGVVTLLAGATSGPAGGSNTQVQYNSSGVLAGSANMTFDGTKLTVAGLKDSALTSGRVTYATTSGELTDSANLAFSGTLLTIDAASSGATSEVLRLSNSGTGANTQAQLKFYTTGTNYGTISGGYGASAPQMTFNLPNATVGNYVWQNASVEQLRLSTTGNITSTRSIATAYSGSNSATWVNGIFLYNTATPATGLANIIQFGNSANVNNAFGVVQNASGYGDFVWAGYNGSFTELGRFTSAGRFLIGTTGSGNSYLQATQAGINATSLTTTTVLNLGTRLGFTGVTNSDGYIFGGIAMGGSGEEYAGIAAYDNGSAAATGLKFFTGTTGGIVEAATVDATGNWMFNTTTAIAKVTIENANLAVGSSANSNQTNVLLAGYGYRSGTTTYGNTSIRSTYSNSNNAASLEFYTATSGTNTTEVGRFTSAGQLLVNTTSTIYNNSKIQATASSGPTIGIQQTTNTEYVGGFWNSSSTADRKLLAFYYGTSGSQLASFEATGTTLLLYGAGSNGISINSSGYVGIATTTPTFSTSFSSTNSTVLQVGNAGSGFGQLRVGGNTSSAIGLTLDYNNSGATTSVIRAEYGATSDNAALYLDSGFVAFRTGASFTERARFTTGGSLCIAATSASTNTGTVIYGYAGNGGPYNNNSGAFWSSNGNITLTSAYATVNFAAGATKTDAGPYWLTGSVGGDTNGYYINLRSGWNGSSGGGDAPAYRIQYGGTATVATITSHTWTLGQTTTASMTLNSSGLTLATKLAVDAGDADAIGVTYNGQRVGLTVTQNSATYNNLFRFGNNLGKWYDYSLTANTSTPTLTISNNNGNGVALTWNSTSWSSTSDERVKDIIEPITNAVAKVRQLRAVIGKYKTDAEGIRRAFLLAQDVQNVLPEAVGESAEINADGIKELVLRYTETIPLLVAAINELGESFESYVATHP